jgi:hypothetical protein
MLDSLDIWNLPSYSEAAARYHDQIGIVDGTDLHLEWRRGAAYRSWDYNAPEERSWPEARRAAAVVVAFRMLARTLAYTPTNLIREYRP